LKHHLYSLYRQTLQFCFELLQFFELKLQNGWSSAADQHQAEIDRERREENYRIVFVTLDHLSIPEREMRRALKTSRRQAINFK